MMEKSCGEFIRALASKEAVPGGGAASALGGALAAAMGQMVGNLTKGKKKYADVQEDIERLVARLEETEARMMALAEADAEVFLPLSKAYALPTATEEERAYKAETLEEALRKACSVPMDALQEGVNALALLKEIGEKGTVLALSDAGVGAAFLRAAIQGAAMNVYANTRLMKDRGYAEAHEKKADALREKGEREAEDIYKQVEARLRWQ